MSETNSEKTEARGRLLQVLPHLRHAMNEAKQEGAAHLGILLKESNGGGRVIASFEAPSFMDDLALVLGAPPQTEDDDQEAKAVQLLQKFGL